jgi:RHS repeat-associated protein
VAYDNDGNATQIASQLMTYDAEDRQVTATGAGAAAQYVYDGEGRRVQKVLGGVTTNYVYDAQDQLAAEYAPQPAASDCGTPICYFTEDHLGSTRLVTDTGGNVAKRFDYLPFGEEIFAGVGGRTISEGYLSTPDPLNPKFTGKLRDNETGLDFFEARYFSGAQGRWTSPDAINLTDARVLNPSNTLNKYIYGGNNPLKYVDPDGRDITVFYTNSGPAGHFWMAAYDQDTDSFAVKDFGPSTDANPALKMLGVDVPGDMNYASHMKSADDVRKYASLTIQTNPEDTQRAIALMNDPTMNMNLNVYSWRGPNCTTVCRDILWQILGANAVGTGVRPIDLWSALFKYYNHGAKVQSAPGKDYGKPRYPTDPFTFVWYELEKQRKPQKPHVTSKIHYDVKPSGEKHCSAGALNGSGEGC